KLLFRIVAGWVAVALVMTGPSPAAPSASRPRLDRFAPQALSWPALFSGTGLIAPHAGSLFWPLHRLNRLAGFQARRDAPRVAAARNPFRRWKLLRTATAWAMLLTAASALGNKGSQPTLEQQESATADGVRELIDRNTGFPFDVKRFDPK